MPNREVEMDRGSIGLLKAARGALHWSQADLAEKSGVSLSTIGKMERHAYEKNKPRRKELRGKTQGEVFFTTKEILDAILSALAEAGVTIDTQGTQTRVVIDLSMGTGGFLHVATGVVRRAESDQ